MIPAFLQDEIKKRLEKLFEGHLFDDPRGNRTNLKVYEQHLPIKKASKDDNSSLYPCVIVQLQQGFNQKVAITLIIGIFNESSDRTGYRDLSTIIQKITTDFAEYPTMTRQYSLAEEPKWAIHDEDVHPYYFAGIELTFQAGLQIERKDVSHLI